MSDNSWDTLNFELAKISIEKSSIERKISKVKHELRTLRKGWGTNAEIRNLRKKLRGYNGTLEDLKAREKPLSEEFEDLDAEMWEEAIYSY